ncbi:uridylate kinase [Micromonospora sp. NPDC051296]|uniref:uridylate kinase n=1 Tax=Micromonospora sp. NPDC051296 TaxID=3155046 RepID=UPI00343D0052
MDHTLRVCADGPDAAGKTTLADDLAVHLSRFRPVIRLSIDRFHRPEAVRRRRGSLSPEGFYRDSFDHDVIVEAVLRPLGPGGDGRYLPGMFDYRADRATGEVTVQAPAAAILLFDGVFMLRPELRDFWDLSIYLHADPEVALARARVRDLEVFGSVEVIEERYRRRYLPGQELYRAEARPAEVATVVLDMNDPLRPTVVRWSDPLRTIVQCLYDRTHDVS